MALVIRSNSDLVYLPDHGFVGEEGALRILVQITRQTRRLDVSHNLLGEEGTLTLIQGLTSLRGRYSTPELGLWGLTEINLGTNSITDKAVDAVVGYAKKDVMLRRVLLQGNDIELRDNFDSILNSLNSSRLHSLSLTNNPLRSASVSRLFQALTTPYLAELHLSMCNLRADAVPAIADYLVSPRSRTVVMLELNGNNIGLEGVRSIIDALENGNYTMRNIGLFGCDSTSMEQLNDELDDGQADTPERQHLERQREREHRLLGQMVAERLPELHDRNRVLTKRVRNAASRCLPRARMLLNAKPPSAIVLAQQAIEAISTGTPQRHFRLLDLPPELLLPIVRHTSGDPMALSNAQFLRLCKDAEGKDGLHRVDRVMRAKEKIWADKSQRREAAWEVREEWLKWGKWDKWECNRPPVASPPGLDLREPTNVTD